MLGIEDQINELLGEIEERDEDTRLYISDRAKEWTHRNRDTKGGEIAERLINALKQGIENGKIRDAEVTTTDEESSYRRDADERGNKT